MRHFHLGSLLVTGLNILAARAFNNSRSDNVSTLSLFLDRRSDSCSLEQVAVYWGQNSYGATHPSDTGNWQQKLAYYCQVRTIVPPRPHFLIALTPG